MQLLKYQIQRVTLVITEVEMAGGVYDHIKIHRIIANGVAND